MAKNGVKKELERKAIDYKNTREQDPIAQAALSSKCADPSTTPASAMPVGVPINLTITGWRKSLRALWIAKTWRIRVWWGLLMCAIGRHEWLEHPALDRNGDPALDELGNLKPGRFARCERPSCRIFRDTPALTAVDRWLETDDFMLLARTDCPTCGGRGWSRKMLLPGSAKAKLACGCLRVQPRFVERVQSRGPNGAA
jgi:hypothetical protein